MYHKNNKIVFIHQQLIGMSCTLLNNKQKLIQKSNYNHFVKILTPFNFKKPFLIYKTKSSIVCYHIRSQKTKHE